MPLFPGVAAADPPQPGVTATNTVKKGKTLDKKPKRKVRKKHQRAWSRTRPPSKGKKRWRRLGKGRKQVEPPIQDTPEVQQAKQHNTLAKELFLQGKFADAAVEYKKAYKASPHPEFLYNRAQCYQQLNTLKDLEKALFYFNSYTKRSSEEASAKNVEAEIAAIKDKIKSIREEQEREKQHAESARLGLIITSDSPPLDMPPPVVSRGSPFYKRWWFWGMLGAIAGGTAAAVVALQPGTIDPVKGTMNPGQIQLP